ncbi:MAG: serine/threonine-protein kinase [Polyangiales bacterium]
MAVESDEIAPATLIANRYRVARKLGAGGMGAVYEAVQEGLGRKVALKVLLPAYAENPEAVARFQREAQAAASLGHPNIVTVTDFGSDAGLVFLVMEFLAGASLAQVIERERSLAQGRSAWIASQVLSALAVAHHAGIVHRDMKPDNVFLTEVSGVRDVVKVLDFGIARFTEQHGNNSKLTSTGAVLGTPAYMSPEQARGRAVDARTDLYSVGVMLYEMLTGSLPFQATNYHALLFAILEETPPALATVRQDLHPALVSVVERAMARDLGTRFQTAEEFRAALAPFVQQSTGAVDSYASTMAMPQVALVTANTIAAPSGQGPAFTGPLPSGSMPTPQPFLQPSAQIAGAAQAPLAATQPATTAPVSAAIAHSASTEKKGSWLPWLGVGAVTVTLAGSGLAYTVSAARERTRHERAQLRDAIAHSSVSSLADTTIAPDAAAIIATPPDAATVALSAQTPRAPTHSAPLRAPRARATSGGARSEPAAARVVAGPTRPVRTVLSGGIYGTASRGEVARQLAPMLPRMTVCANLAHLASDEGAEDGWGMDFVFSIDTASGRVLDVRPHGDTTRAKPRVTACVHRLLAGYPLVPGGDAPSAITLSFTNRYVR